MRPTLLASDLKNAAENLKFSPGASVFEVARVYLPTGPDELPDERRTLSLVMAGACELQGLYGAQRDVDFFDAKGAVEAVLPRLGAKELGFRPVQHPSLHPGRAAEILSRGVPVGIVGELHPVVARQFGIITAGRVAVAEVDLVALYETGLAPVDYRTVSRFQPLEQDFAVVVDEDVAASDVAAAIAAGAGALLSGLRLFDVYRGQAVGEGKKSLAFRVTLSAPDRALPEHEVERVRGRIEGQVKRRVSGALRA
jgi:phenylalanyl-tRNA synthetase beta chain